MPYIITKTNGVELTTIDDATLDLTTNLALPGRNYSGYGLVVNENFVKLLENFAGPTRPSRPLQGELWFNSTSKRLSVYDGSTYKGLASVYIQNTTPSGSRVGDLWWDVAAQQLKGFNGSSYTVIGPSISNTSTAYWISADVTPVGGENDPLLQSSIGILEGFAGASAAVTISSETFEPELTNISANFPMVYRGITLAGADPTTGVSSLTTATTGTGYILWGTSAHSLLSEVSRSTNAMNVMSTSSGASNFFVPFGTSGSTGTSKIYVNSSFYYNANTNVLYVTASQAGYADIAERYESDDIYEHGTVLVIGGEKEVTMCFDHASTAIAGIVSASPGYMLNADAGNDDTHPYIALKGKVLCKVHGNIKKGDLLVSSGEYPGYATKKKDVDSPNAVLGRALESLIGDVGMIQVKV